MTVQLPMWDDPRLQSRHHILTDHHYLGDTARGDTYQDEHGVLVVAPPTSRALPLHWLELTRWCILGGHNAGSRQWANARRWITNRYPEATTVVSYSDPSVGHTGALYRACGWLWAPTWHRLREPPSGNGTWDGQHRQSPKDRWVYVLHPDPLRAHILAVRDAACTTLYPYAEYQEPRWRRGRPVQGTGGGDYKRWISDRV